MIDVALWLNFMLLLVAFSVIGGASYYFIKKANGDKQKS